MTKPSHIECKRPNTPRPNSKITDEGELKKQMHRQRFLGINSPEQIWLSEADKIIDAAKAEFPVLKIEGTGTFLITTNHYEKAVADWFERWFGK